MMQVKDIMRKRVVTLQPWMTTHEAAQVFVDKDITGAPVVDADGKLVGVLSQTDLIRRQREASPDEEVPSFYREGGETARGFHVERPDQTRVEELMTPAVLSAEETTPVDQVAQVMLQRHIHRIMITRRGRLCGIVTSMDMLRALLALARGPKNARPVRLKI